MNPGKFETKSNLAFFKAGATLAIGFVFVGAMLSGGCGLSSSESTKQRYQSRTFEEWLGDLKRPGKRQGPAEALGSLFRNVETEGKGETGEQRSGGTIGVNQIIAANVRAEKDARMYCNIFGAKLQSGPRAITSCPVGYSFKYNPSFLTRLFYPAPREYRNAMVQWAKAPYVLNTTCVDDEMASTVNVYKVQSYDAWVSDKQGRKRRKVRCRFKFEIDLPIRMKISSKEGEINTSEVYFLLASAELWRKGYWHYVPCGGFVPRLERVWVPPRFERLELRVIALGFSSCKRHCGEPDD